MNISRNCGVGDAAYIPAHSSSVGAIAPGRGLFSIGKEKVMPFVVEKKVLFDMLKKTIGIIQTKSSLQILSNLKLSLSPETIETTTTDLDNYIKVSGEIKGDGEVELAVNARKLFEVVRELSEGPLTLSVDENVITIESGDSFVCKIAGMDANEFPQFPDISDKKQIDVSLSALNDMIRKTTFAVAKDDARPALAGVLWEINADKTGMVATEGHKLGSCFYAGEFNVDSKIRSIVPPKSLLHLASMFSQEQQDKKVSVSFGGKHVLFNYEGVSLCTKLIDCKYPDCDNVIPKNNPKKAVIEKNILQEAVRRVSVLSNQKTHLAKFIFRKNELEIMAANNDVCGEARQRIPIIYDGEEHIIGFNTQFLLEIIGIVSSQKIRMEMSTKTSACLILPECKTESDDLFLLMPLKIIE